MTGWQRPLSFRADDWRDGAARERTVALPSLSARSIQRKSFTINLHQAKFTWGHRTYSEHIKEANIVRLSTAYWNNEARIHMGRFLLLKKSMHICSLQYFPVFIYGFSIWISPFSVKAKTRETSRSPQKANWAAPPNYVPPTFFSLDVK